MARAGRIAANTARTGVGVAGRKPNGLRGLFVEREVPHARTGKSDPMQDKSDDPSGTVRHRENASQIWREGPPAHPAPCHAQMRPPRLREDRGCRLGYRGNTGPRASTTTAQSQSISREGYEGDGPGERPSRRSEHGFACVGRGSRPQRHFFRRTGRGSGLNSCVDNMMIRASGNMRTSA